MILEERSCPQRRELTGALAGAGDVAADSTSPYMRPSKTVGLPRIRWPLRLRQEIQEVPRSVTRMPTTKSVWKNTGASPVHPIVRCATYRAAAGPDVLTISHP